MKAGLKEINDLEGIWGSLILNNQGGVIINACPPGLSGAALSNISNHLIELLSSAGSSLAGLSEIVLHYQQRRLFLLDLEQAVLVVFCTPTADIPLLRMTANVVVTNWQSDPKVQKQFQGHFVERL